MSTGGAGATAARAPIAPSVRPVRRVAALGAELGATLTHSGAHGATCVLASVVFSASSPPLFRCLFGASRAADASPSGPRLGLRRSAGDAGRICSPPSSALWRAAILMGVAAVGAKDIFTSCYLKTHYERYLKPAAIAPARLLATGQRAVYQKLVSRCVTIHILSPSPASMGRSLPMSLFDGQAFDTACVTRCARNKIVPRWPERRRGSDAWPSPCAPLP